MLKSVFSALLLTLVAGSPCALAQQDTPIQAPASHGVERPAPGTLKHIPAERKHNGTTTKIIPLPIYATLPNEGSTWGFMPVFLTVQNKTQFTDSIVAPSISWNKIIRFTGTYRLYYYPSAIESLTFIPSVSTNVNRGVTLEYLRQPTTPGKLMLDIGAHARRSIFYRFFGLGPQTKAADESSYTRVGLDMGGRVAYSLTQYFSAGLRVTLQRDLVEQKHVDFLPLTNDRFPGTAGIGGSTTFFEGISLRYDTRANREYSTYGSFTELTGGLTHGLAGTNAFSKTQFESRLLWEEFSSWLNGGARLFWSYTGGNGDIPFYQQSSLGGSFRLRGFTEDRFIDKGAWEVELEQRLVLFKTHIYGVVADWRLDPFVAIGQVYQDARDMFRYAKVSGGLGFRAFVHPNVLGRVDTAVGGEGLKIYVELGYPF